ncbi:MAG: hypothetical protein Q8Q12_03040, partial [bacterium]|nr:hypothetical protein [bacterium]
DGHGSQKEISAPAGHDGTSPACRVHGQLDVTHVASAFVVTNHLYGLSETGRIISAADCRT